MVINLDLENFFPSITVQRVRKAFRSLGWGRSAATILTNICTHERRLPQGAPTSPALCNLACRRLDERLAALARTAGGSYTRYADDITVSFPHFGRNKALRPKPKDAERLPRPARPTSRALLTVIRGIIEEEGFRIQMKKKVRVQRPHQRQTATGLVVNREVNLPRALRRRIRAMQHRRQSGRLNDDEQQRLRGLEAFARMVESQRKSQSAEA
ncbi:MAG: reverse transcriptase family protein [Acidobacteria bacterium]|nr:reverse transcriptase family protein [Acidobacteriota bacterium]